jgi:hypothetical protein
MRTKILFSLLFCSFLSHFAFAQREETVLGHRGLGITGGWGGWTSGLTKLGGDYTAISGGFGGAEFGKTLLIGGGGYHLISDIKWDGLHPQKFEMNYGGLMVGVGIKSWSAIHPTITIMGGSGTTRLAGEGSDKIFVVQPAAGLEINVLRWFHIGLEGGYRFVADSDLPSLTDTRLSSPFGEVKLKFGYSFGKGRKKKFFDQNND